MTGQGWRRVWRLGAACLALLMAGGARSQGPGDIPTALAPATAGFDFVRREVMIPMRDGVSLHTVIVIPKGAAGAPLLLTRTPYDAAARAARRSSPHMAAILPMGEEVFAQGGYIRVFQDVRGKYGSEGVYVNERPLRGPLNASSTDHATDAWDTIDWLVKNIPESNGRVGMIGTSYDGMMVLMALTAPHPAMKVAVAVNPVVNTWMGDDDFHGGAFRLIGYDYYYSQQAQKGAGETPWRETIDDYDVYLRAGSAADFARSRGLDQLPFPARMAQHPAYDDFWRAQALEAILASRSVKTPTLFVAGLWDQEDGYGAVAAWQAARSTDREADHHLVIGPWSHNQAYRDGSALGPIRFGQDTAADFRRDVLRPFLDQHLKDGAAKADLPPVMAYETGSNRWRRLQTWPESCATGCARTSRDLHLQPGGGLAFAAPRTGDPFDAYLSDPAKPVPYRVRPIRPIDAEDSTWNRWMVDDQRPFSDRPDVLVYATEPLTAPIAIAGAPVVNLSASTTGTDADWVVKLIDVYPDEVPSDPGMGGYQLMVSADIFRGRYRNGFDRAAPIKPGAVTAYRWALPNASHVFLPGHRIMVQVQSSWFPLYDRNPQTFVENIFFARPSDYQKATQRIFHTARHPSFIALPTTSDPIDEKVTP